MRNLKFNTLYIIESLRENDTKTGLALYEDVKLQEYIHEHVHVEYFSLETAEEWDELMAAILTDCITKEIYPIIHLEIHGDEFGIQFTNNECRSREVVGEQFRRINIATGCNLFLTLGVCKGLYVLFSTKIDKPMPFCGAVGSFEKMVAGDIQLRYAEFYETFFRTFDITQAYIQLMKTETGAPIKYTQYRYIHLDEIFYKGYLNYIEEKCNAEVMPERALEAAVQNNLPLHNRAERRDFQRKFAKCEKSYRSKYYKDAANSFFMLTEYPDNKERFEVPSTYNELNIKCKNLITMATGYYYAHKNGNSDERGSERGTRIDEGSQRPRPRPRKIEEEDDN